MGEKPVAASAPAGDRHAVLLCAASGGRVAIPLAEVARLEEFPRSAVERVGRQRVVQYRGEILPLIDVARVLRRTGARRPARKRRRAALSTRGPLQVVVHAGTGQPVGLVVGRILDIVEETITTRAPATRPGVQFAAVVQDRVTEFLDVEQLVRSAARGAGP